MGRKKKRWREMDDPADIFGGERSCDGDALANDPAYDAFRRHIEEHIQGETRAFHELRSTAEHELQAAAIVTSPPRRMPSKKIETPETPKKVPTLPPPAVMQAPAAVRSRGMSGGTMVLLGLVFTSIGFLSHSAWQQMQPTSRKGQQAAAKANCSSDKVISAKKSLSVQPKTPAPMPTPVPPPPEPAPVAAVTPPPAPPPAEALPAAAEPTSKGITMRAAEIRKGPGSAFEIVDSLPPGFALEGSLTTDRQWLRVRPGAFVSVDAVQFQDAASAGYQSFWVGSHIANIREFPLTTARIVRKADPGAELKLQIFNGEWAQVAGGGFVFRKLVTAEAPQVLQLPALMRVSVEKAEIRSGPGPQYPILGLYFRNHKVEVQELQSGWLRVGQDQYIRAQEMELSARANSDKTM